MPRRCIYCLRGCAEDAFDHEHVIPRQLGGFRSNPTLTESVCADCNRYFGETIELALGRGSIEAVYPFDMGKSDPRSFRGFEGERLTFRIPANLPAGGVILFPAPSPDGKNIVMNLPPQQGVQLQGEAEWHYYTEEELTGPGAPATTQGAKLRLLAADEHGLQRIRAAVLSRFPKFREEGILDLPRPQLLDGQALVEIKSTVDRLLARSVAKISFNHMAHHAGYDFALNSSFDAVRSFIRFDEGPDDWQRFVRFISKPLLAEETDQLMVTRGHIVIVGWKNLDTLAVTFSPYNAIAYEVTIADPFKELWQPLKIGHVFDWEHHEIVPLTANDKIILPPGFATKAARAYQAMVRRPPM